MATGPAIITYVFPPQERGKALGINAMFVYVGLSLGPVLGGVLTALFSWPAIFWVNVPIGLTVMALAWFVSRVGTEPPIYAAPVQHLPRS